MAGEVWRCGGVEVWRCGGVEVWRCGGVEVWRCGGIRMRKTIFREGAGRRAILAHLHSPEPVREPVLENPLRSMCRAAGCSRD